MAGHALAPFHMHVDILNKTEVIASKVGGWWGTSAAANFMVSEANFASKISGKLTDMLPSTFKDEAGIDLSVSELKAEKSGTKFVLEVQILGFDMAALGQKGFNLNNEAAARFKSAFDEILNALERMDMSDRASSIQDKVGMKVRNNIMQKLLAILPEKFLEQGVKIDIDIPEYESSAMVDQAEKCSIRSQPGLGLGEPLWFEVSIQDRNALLDEAIDKHSIAGKLQLFAAGHLPDGRFNDLIARKLESKVPGALAESAGIKAICEQVPGQNGCLLIKIIVQEFDQKRLLTLAKSQEFADAFESLFASLRTLEELGVSGIQEKIDVVNGRIAAQVCKKLRQKLQAVLTEKLHATVTFATPDAGTSTNLGKSSDRMSDASQEDVDLKEVQWQASTSANKVNPCMQFCLAAEREDEIVIVGA
jgi:hypothetical protein